MGFGEILSRVGSLFHAQPVVGIAGVIATGLLFYFKPRPMLKLVATLLVFAAVFYAFSLVGNMTSTGYSQKVKMVDKAP